MANNEKSAAAEKIAAAEKVKAKKPKSDKPNIFVRAWKAIVRFFKDAGDLSHTVHQIDKVGRGLLRMRRDEIGNRKGFHVRRLRPFPV